MRLRVLWISAISALAGAVTIVHDSIRSPSSVPEAPSALEAFNHAPHGGKLAANLILKQTSTDEAERILEVFRAQGKKTDEIVAEAAWCELICYLDHNRAAQVRRHFGFISAGHPTMKEAGQYARDNLSIKALDKDAIKATPGNGRRVHEPVKIFVCMRMEWTPPPLMPEVEERKWTLSRRRHHSARWSGEE